RTGGGGRGADCLTCGEGCRAPGSRCSPARGCRPARSAPPAGPGAAPAVPGSTTPCASEAPAAARRRLAPQAGPRSGAPEAAPPPRGEPAPASLQPPAPIPDAPSLRKRSPLGYVFPGFSGTPVGTAVPEDCWGVLRGRSPVRRAFTLIELLVVIA